MGENTQHNVLTTSLKALADLNVLNKFVGISGVYAKEGEIAQGVIQAETKAGQWAPVMTIGVALVTAGGNITAGDTIQSNADGNAVKSTTGTILGVSLDTVSTGGRARIVLGI